MAAPKCFDLTIKFIPLRHSVQSGNFGFECPIEDAEWNRMADAVSVTNLKTGKASQRAVAENQEVQALQKAECRLHFPHNDSVTPIEIKISPQADSCRIGAYQIQVSATRTRNMNNGACPQ